MAVSSTNGTGLIQALGIGSGLDIQSLVSQLVTAESAPVQNRLSRQASDVATQVSAMGTLRGALAAFQSALTPLKDTAVFDVLSAQSADIEVFTATADSDAVAGAYEIEVQQLAKAEQLVSNAFVGGASSVVGDGTLTVTLGTTAFSVGIGATSNTLAQIRDAINTASDNPGVRATLVYGQTGARLVLSSTATGASNSIRVSAAGGDGGLAQLTYAGGVSPNYTQNQAAQDAIVRISGVEKHSASNVISDAIDGVAITLKSEDPGNTATLAIASDQDAVAANVRKFVTAYNAMRTKLDSLSFYDAASKTAGPLLGDPLMSGVESQLRRLTTSAVAGLTGNFTSLAAIGITSDAKGKLVLNEDKLDVALSADRGAVAKLFGATGGIAARLDTALTQQLAGSGTMAARDKSLVDAQKAINTEGLRHQSRMLAVQQRYLAQFSALDSLMQQMNQTSTFLTQQLAQLDQATSG